MWCWQCDHVTSMWYHNIAHTSPRPHSQKGSSLLMWRSCLATITGGGGMWIYQHWVCGIWLCFFRECCSTFAETWMFWGYQIDPCASSPVRKPKGKRLQSSHREAVNLSCLEEGRVHSCYLCGGLNCLRLINHFITVAETHQGELFYLGGFW